MDTWHDTEMDKETYQIHKIIGYGHGICIKNLRKIHGS